MLLSPLIVSIEGCRGVPVTLTLAFCSVEADFPLYIVTVCVETFAPSARGQLCPCPFSPSSSCFRKVRAFLPRFFIRMFF